MTDLADLARRLRSQAQAAGALVLDGSVLGDGVRADLRTAFGLAAGSDLTIAGVQPTDIADPVDGVLTTSAGNASVLLQHDRPVQLAFSAPGGELQLVVDVALGDGWRITDSYPALTMFPFPQLVISGAHVVFTTAGQDAYPWPGDPAATVELARGPNLLAPVTLDGLDAVAALLGPTLGTPPYKLHGPFRPAPGQALPMVDLRAPLGTGSFGLGTAPDAVELLHPALGVRVGPATAEDPFSPVDLLVEADIGTALHGAIRIPALGGPYALEIEPLPHRADIVSVIQSLPGGRDFTAYVPAELTAIFENVSLDGLVMLADLTPNVGYLALAVGTSGTWPVIPDVLVLEGLSLRVETVDPGGWDWAAVTIAARSRFLPKVFPGEIDVTVGLRHAAAWEVDTISAAYDGVVTVGQIAAGLLGSADSVPTGMRSIGLGEIGIVATRPAPTAAFAYRFSGSANTAVPLHDDLVLVAALDVLANTTSTGHAVHLAGSAAVGEEYFDLALDLGTAGSHLTARWASTGAPLGFADLAAALGWFDMPAVPPALDLALESAAFAVDFGDRGASVVAEATSARYGNAVLQTTRIGNARVWVFGVTVPLHVTLADIPLVGDRLPHADQLGLDGFGAWLVSQALTQAEVAQLNAANPLPADHPRLPDRAVTTPATLFGSLLLGETTQAIDVPVGTPPAAESPPTDLATAAADAPASTDHTRWFSVEKTFGVFTIHRVGLQYVPEGNVLQVGLDAQIALGPLTFDLLGLTLGSPLTTFQPHFGLRGLGVSYALPLLRIDGALYALPADQLGDGVAFQYDGVAVVQAPTFTLAAVASYAQEKDGSPSLFVFGQLRVPMGGPPAFSVTGVMGGFGFNRALTLPTPDQVPAFPLLALGTAADPARVLDILEGRTAPPGGGAPTAWIRPRTGEHWLAFGVEFTTFELIEGRALLAAELGTELVFALLGVATLRLPRKAPEAETYVRAELEIDAVLRPAAGSFALTALLSPDSYVLAPAARLTGGFAVSAWFGPDPRAGQFAFTIGGYHPAFTPPAGFPQVPRVGLSWAVSELVTVTGSAYLALTPSCAMAGGSLEVVYHSGPLRAWFTAHTDVLVAWHPFSFLADVGVSIGVAYTLDVLGITKTLSASVGASMTLWGPPTGGTVTVHLWFVSFTVDFGARPMAPDDARLTPAAFADLLPAAPVSVSVTGGLSASFDDTETPGREVWVVRPGSFSFTTDTAVPATTVAYGGTTATATTPVPTGLALDVRPMGLKGLAGDKSTHTVRVQDRDDGTWHDLRTWSPRIRRQARPVSLWGAPLSDGAGSFTQAPSQPSADLLAAAPVGADFSLPGAEPGRSTGVVDLDEVAYQPVAGDGRSPLAPAVSPTHDFVPVPSPTSIGQVAQLATGQAAAGRAALVGALRGAGLFAGPSDPMTALAADAGHLFTDPPLVVP